MDTRHLPVSIYTLPYRGPQVDSYPYYEATSVGMQPEDKKTFKMSLVLLRQGIPQLAEVRAVNQFKTLT